MPVRLAAFVLGSKPLSASLLPYLAYLTVLKTVSSTLPVFKPPSSSVSFSPSLLSLALLLSLTHALRHFFRKPFIDSLAVVSSAHSHTHTLTCWQAYDPVPQAGGACRVVRLGWVPLIVSSSQARHGRGTGPPISLPRSPRSARTLTSAFPLPLPLASRRPAECGSNQQGAVCPFDHCCR